MSSTPIEEPIHGGTIRPATSTSSSKSENVPEPDPLSKAAVAPSAYSGWGAIRTAVGVSLVTSLNTAGTLAAAAREAIGDG